MEEPWKILNESIREILKSEATNRNSPTHRSTLIKAIPISNQFRSFSEMMLNKWDAAPISNVAVPYMTSTGEIRCE